MKTLAFKSMVFLGGILVFITALACLPLDTFTFRNWESMLWGTDLRPTIGKFYPNKTVRRVESGDLGHGSKYQELKKNILWKTDRFGFRNDPEKSKDCRIVLVGDSNSVGTGTSQASILSEQLSDRLNAPVYNYSPMGIDADFINNLEAMRIRPRMVIYETSGVGIPPFDSTFLNPNRGIRQIVKERTRDFLNADSLMWFEIALDRFWKREPLRCLQSRIDSAFGVLAMPVIVGDDNMLFLKESLTGEFLDNDIIQKNAETIAAISTSLKSLGIDFVFVPLPDKESIYRELLSRNIQGELKNQDFFIKLKRELDQRGVKSVDLHSRFRADALAGKRLYFSDDKHWNTAGIEIASDLIVSEIAR